MNNYIDEIIKGIYENDKLGFDREKAPLISNYQKKLINSGWMHVVNGITTNYLISIDSPREPLKDSLRRMKNDFETRICPRRKIEFFRAYDVFGRRIPYPLKNKLWREFENVAVVAVYVKDGE